MTKTIIKNDYNLKDLKPNNYLFLDIIELDDNKYGVRDWENLELKEYWKELFQVLSRDYDIFTIKKHKLMLEKNFSKHIRQGLNYIRLEKDNNKIEFVLNCKIRKWND